MAKVISLYISRNSRLASPKYLLGESYGGFRAAKVARALQREQSMAVAGIVMVSPLLEGAFVFGHRFALDAALRFPAYVAAELERRNAFSAQAVAEAERFAMTEYLVTLAGKPPEGERARAFYEKVARMTGLSYEVVEAARGFIGEAAGKIRGEDGGRLVSIYDGRVTVADPFPEAHSDRRVDPILDGATRAYGSAFVAYARDELGFKTEMTYALLAPGRWDWGEGSGRLGASASDDLRVLLALDPNFRLIVAHGYSDLVTPYGPSRYVLDHLPVGTERVALRLYRGGHMLYMDEESRRRFTDDAAQFYRRR
jgi:carboxypeptidase C (cathepsin A)